MKKLTIFIVFFLLTTHHAQDLKIGVTGNFHKSSILGVHDVSKSKFGGSLGAVAELQLAEGDISGEGWLFLMPQIEYSMQGEHADFLPERYGRQKFNYDYLAAQLYLKYFIRKNKAVTNFYVFAGPRVEFLVREDRKVDPAYDIRYAYLKDQNVNSYGFGVSGGVGAKLNDQFEVFIRYDRGLTKVYPERTDRNTFNHQLGLGLNYYFYSQY